MAGSCGRRIHQQACPGTNVTLSLRIALAAVLRIVSLLTPPCLSCVTLQVVTHTGRHKLIIPASFPVSCMDSRGSLLAYGGQDLFVLQSGEVQCRASFLCLSVLLCNLLAPLSFVPGCNVARSLQTKVDIPLAPHCSLGSSPFAFAALSSLRFFESGEGLAACVTISDRPADLHSLATSSSTLLLFNLNGALQRCVRPSLYLWLFQ